MKTKTAGIYMLTNLVNNKKYIGQALDIERRLRSYLGNYPKLKGQRKIYNAIQKYGIVNFKIETIFIVENQNDKDKIKDILDEKEIYFIELHNTFRNGYNLTKGGGGTRGYKISQETRRKKSLAMKGKTLSLETKQKLSLAKKGKTHSLESKQKMSLAKKGKTFSLESKQKMSLAKQNMPLETRQKISLANKGKSNGRLGKTLSLETKQKISLAKQNISLETKQKLSLANKGKILSEEHKQKISLALKNKPLTPKNKFGLRLSGKITKQKTQLFKTPNPTKQHFDFLEMSHYEKTKELPFINKVGFYFINNEIKYSRKEIESAIFIPQLYDLVSLLTQKEKKELYFELFKIGDIDIQYCIDFVVNIFKNKRND